MGAKRRQKSIVKGNTADFQAQKAGAKICFQEHREKRGKRTCHAWQIFFPRHVNEITSGRKSKTMSFPDFIPKALLLH